MRRFFRSLALSAALAGAAAAPPAAAVDGEESYSLLFRQGTLDAIERDSSLVYTRDVVSALNPDAEERDTGRVHLQLQDGAPLAELQFRQGDKRRGLGQFPVSVGNPIIMYFYETVVRDMAEAAGGSPFYIRNRVKEALTRPGEIESGQSVFNGETIETTTVRLLPFADDPNRGRMQGFGDLALNVTMSDDVPGWYLSLVAEARSDGGVVYRSALVFEAVEPGE